MYSYIYIWLINHTQCKYIIHLKWLFFVSFNIIEIFMRVQVHTIISEITEILQMFKLIFQERYNVLIVIPPASQSKYERHKFLCVCIVISSGLNFLILGHSRLHVNTVSKVRIKCLSAARSTSTYVCLKNYQCEISIFHKTDCERKCKNK